MGQLRQNIGIDGRCLSGHLTGIGRYVFELIKELDLLLPTARFFVYSPFELSVTLPSKRWVHRSDQGGHARRFLSGYMWLKFCCGRLAREDSLDVFWANRTLLPNLAENTKTIVTVHDLNHMLAPETMPFINYWAHRFWFKSDVMKADKVLVNSQGTATRLAELIGRQADGIARPSVSSVFRPPSKNEVIRIRERYGLDTPYLLAVGTQEPRKNLQSLIKAFLLLKSRGELVEHRLVLAGSQGWKNKELVRLLESAEARSIFSLGYIPNEDLPGLFGGADLFVFPSFYEGFGMPVLEARACGTKVVASDIPELREAGGGDAIYTDTTPFAIAEGILTALSSERVPQQIGVHESTWRESAEILSAALTSKN